jgi:hypothetical protein
VLLFANFHFSWTAFLQRLLCGQRHSWALQ